MNTPNKSQSEQVPFIGNILPLIHKVLGEFLPKNSFTEKLSENFPPLKPYSEEDRILEKELLQKIPRLENQISQEFEEIERNNLERPSKNYQDKRTALDKTGVIFGVAATTSSFFLSGMVTSGYIQANSTDGSWQTAFGLASVVLFISPVAKFFIQTSFSLWKLEIERAIGALGVVGGAAILIPQLCQKYFYEVIEPSTNGIPDFGQIAQSVSQVSAQPEILSHGLLYVGVLLVEFAFSYAMCSLALLCILPQRSKKEQRIKEDNAKSLRKIDCWYRDLDRYEGVLAALSYRRKQQEAAAELISQLFKKIIKK